MKSINNILLYKGNCIDILKTLPDSSIDAVIADPPYVCLNKSNRHTQWDKEINMEALWPELLRVCKTSAPILLFGQGLFSAKLIMSNPKLYRYDLIWRKGGRVSGFLNVRRQPLREHEQILVFYQSQPTYNPQMIKCSPHQRNHSRGKKECSTNRCYGSYNKTEEVVTDLKYPRSVIDISREHKDFYHPTQKPVALMEWLVKTYTMGRATYSTDGSRHRES